MGILAHPAHYPDLADGFVNYVNIGSASDRQLQDCGGEGKRAVLSEQVEPASSGLEFYGIHAIVKGSPGYLAYLGGGEGGTDNGIGVGGGVEDIEFF